MRKWTGNPPPILNGKSPLVNLEHEEKTLEYKKH